MGKYIDIDMQTKINKIMTLFQITSAAIFLVKNMFFWNVSAAMAEQFKYFLSQVFPVCPRFKR